MNRLGQKARPDPASNGGGVHDYLNKPIWYNQLGAIRQDLSSAAQFFGEVANVLNVAVATPFVAASVLPSYSYSVLAP